MTREMKDSGLDWVGMIPSDWAVERNKNLFTEVNTRCENGDNYTLLSVSEYYGIAPKADKIDDGDFETHAETLDGYKVCQKDDIIMNIMLAWKRATGKSNYDGIVSPAYCVYRKVSDIDTEYYHYLFRTDACADMFRRFSTGIIDSRLRLYPNVFLSLYNIVPPLNEQTRIAAFLDRKCSEIDAVIAKTQATIEEYKALKQSIITEAVTKGVRGDRPMKDSGIEWIGEIPEEWEISRVGLHYNIILGKMICSEQPSDDYSLEPYFCAANVHFDGISSDELKKMWFSQSEKASYKVESGDLLVVEGGAGAGGSAIVSDICEDVYIQNSIMIVRGKRHNDNRFLRYLMEMLVKRGYVDFVCNKATIPHFTKDKLSNVPYPVIPQEELIGIANYLDAKCAEIDSLVAVKMKLLSELESYKKSVIYEYVTGKKGV